MTNTFQGRDLTIIIVHVKLEEHWIKTVDRRNICGQNEMKIYYPQLSGHIITS